MANNCLKYVREMKETTLGSKSLQERISDLLKGTTHEQATNAHKVINPGSPLPLLCKDLYKYACHHNPKERKLGLGKDKKGNKTKRLNLSPERHLKPLNDLVMGDYPGKNPEHHPQVIG